MQFKLGLSLFILVFILFNLKPALQYIKVFNLTKTKYDQVFSAKYDEYSK